MGRSVGADGGQLSKKEEEEKQRDPRKRNGPQLRWEDTAEGWKKGGEDDRCRESAVDMEQWKGQ